MSALPSLEVSGQLPMAVPPYSTDMPARLYRIKPDWSLLAVVSVPVALVVFLAAQSYFAIDRELTEAALSRRTAIARLAAVTLSENFDRLVDVGTSVTSSSRVRELVGTGNWADAIKFLAGVRSGLSYIDRILLTDTDGVLRAAVPDVAAVTGIRFSDHDWYQGVSREWKPYVSDVYLRTAAPQHNVFAVATPIRGAGGEVAGILVLQMRLDTFFEWTREVDIGEGGYLYVVDRKGRVAFRPGIAAQGDIADSSMVPAVRQALKGERGVEVAVSGPEKEENVIAYQPIPKFGWAVIAQQPAKAAFESRNGQLTRLLIAYTLIVSLCASVAYLALRVVHQRRRSEIDQSVKAELEHRVMERTAQLEIANKELEAFSYSVSHDLRSPLRAVDGFSHMLEEDYARDLGEEGKRLLAVIRDNSRRMGMLIDDLLAFSRLGRQTINPVKIDMTALVKEAWAEIHAGEKATFKIGPLPEAHADRALLKQVWLNLLANALKYSGKRDGAVIEVSGQEYAGEIAYRVSDNGVGFDMQYYDKLYGVFQRLHGAAEFPGTGVGLAIVQRIVTRHGGRVWAEGKVNEGARFYFGLPKEGGT
jgi:signal transduction histidine kinase